MIKKCKELMKWWSDNFYGIKDLFSSDKQTRNHVWKKVGQVMLISWLTGVVGGVIQYFCESKIDDKFNEDIRRLADRKDLDKHYSIVDFDRDKEIIECKASKMDSIVYATIMSVVAVINIVVSFKLLKRK